MREEITHTYKRIETLTSDKVLMAQQKFFQMTEMKAESDLAQQSILGTKECSENKFLTTIRKHENTINQL